MEPADGRSHDIASAKRHRQVMTGRNDLDLTALKERLLARRAELERFVAEHQEEARPVDADPQRYGRLTRMDELQSQAMARETERRRQAELVRIASALKRIAEGEYGYCAACGEDIDRKRLELDPTVASCIDCARQGRG
jgi:DnaK suppressor protein